MVNTKQAVDADHIQNFIKMNSDSFEVTSLDDGAVKIRMKMTKDMFNPEIARILYDHGKEIFKSRSMANYSDVNETLERVVYFDNKNDGMEFLIKDTSNAISEYALSSEKRRHSFMQTSPNTIEKKSILDKIANKLRYDNDLIVDLH